MNEISHVDGVVPAFETTTLAGAELDTWDRIAARFDDFSIEQSVAYMAPRVGLGRLCGVLFRHPESRRIAGAALVALAMPPVVQRGVAFIKFGPLWRPGGEAASLPALASVLGAIRDEFAGRRRLVVRLFPPPDSEFDGEWEYALTLAGYRAGRLEPDPYRYFVDLGLSEREQLASLGKDWRSNLRKASPDLAMDEVEPRAGLPQFMALYEAMWHRKRYEDRHNVAFLPAFVQAAPVDLKVRMFMAFHDGQPVAGTIVVGPGERIFVIFGASSDAALRLRAGYALRWWMVNRLRSSGSRWLDLGGAEGDGGLRHFKAGLSGKQGWVVLVEAERVCGSDPLSVATGIGVDAARALIRRPGSSNAAGLPRRLLAQAHGSAQGEQDR